MSTSGCPALPWRSWNDSSPTNSKGSPLPFPFVHPDAGHYVPAVGREIVAREKQQQQQQWGEEEEEGTLDLNFAGIGIGNGLVHPSIQYRWYLPYAEAKGLVRAKPPPLSFSRRG